MSADSKISVVVQGPFIANDSNDGPSTQRVLESVRRALPEAEIVLSTWRGQAWREATCDVLVESVDPGSMAGSRAQNFLANTERQIVSTAAGLARASRPLALKMRTDTWLESADFVRQWEERRGLGLAPRHLSAKVLISAFSTLNPLRTPVPYHPADFFQFGLRNDLRKLWAVPSPTIEDATWFRAGSARRWLNVGSGGEMDRAERVTPEQFLFLAFLRQSGVRVNQAGIRSFNPWKFVFSEYRLAAHFIPADHVQAGFRLPERFRKYAQPQSILYRDDLDTTLFTAPTPAAALGALQRRTPRLVAAAFAEARSRWSLLRQRIREHRGTTKTT